MTETTPKTLEIRLTSLEAHALLRVIAEGNASKRTESLDKTASTWVAKRILASLERSSQ